MGYLNYRTWCFGGKNCKCYIENNTANHGSGKKKHVQGANKAACISELPAENEERNWQGFINEQRWGLPDTVIAIMVLKYTHGSKQKKRGGEGERDTPRAVAKRLFWIWWQRIGFFPSGSFADRVRASKYGAKDKWHWKENLLSGRILCFWILVVGWGYGSKRGSRLSPLWLVCVVFWKHPIATVWYTMPDEMCPQSGLTGLFLHSKVDPVHVRQTCSDEEVR